MASHTTTGEWQSFELRMRRRRAERLTQRAQAAIDAGHLDDARLCAAEARALDPALPELAALDEKIAPIAVKTAPRNTQRGARIGAAFVAAAVVLIAAWTMAPSVTSEPPRETAPTESAAEPRDGGPVGETVRATPTVSAPVVPDIAPEKPSDERRKESIGEARDTIASTSRERAAALPRVEPQVSRSRQPDAPNRTNETDRAPVEAETIAVPLAAPILPPATVPAPPVVEPPQEPAVKSVLNRYASAYNALDADAAQQVWPGVNRGALARAFDNLESQHITLDDCRVDVAGSTATATCAGSAAWTPKVGGGGQRSASRRWTFELARAGAAWQIVNARVQTP